FRVRVPVNAMQSPNKSGESCPVVRSPVERGHFTSSVLTLQILKHLHNCRQSCS
ncbi:hypothetical protein NDU88_009193, partial [Pleurodeles waltl]